MLENAFIERVDEYTSTQERRQYLKSLFPFFPPSLPLGVLSGLISFNS